jgi:hypothetical protein
MNRSVMLCLAAALPLLIGACAPEKERTAFEELSRTADQEEGYRTDAPAPVTPVPETGHAGTTVTGSLAEINRSGVSGGVTLTGANGQTQVLLRVSGLQPGVTVTPTLHEGYCDVTPGRVVEQLDQITADGSGGGTATTTAPVPPGQVMDGRHSVRIYTGPSEAVPPVACANIPAGTATGTPVPR